MDLSSLHSPHHSLLSQDIFSNCVKRKAERFLILWSPVTCLTPVCFWVCNYLIGFEEGVLYVYVLESLVKAPLPQLHPAPPTLLWVSILGYSHRNPTLSKKNKKEHGSCDLPTLNQAGSWGTVISPAWVSSPLLWPGWRELDWPPSRGLTTWFAGTIPKRWYQGSLSFLCPVTFSATFVLIQSWNRRARLAAAGWVHDSQGHDVG